MKLKRPKVSEGPWVVEPDPELPPHIFGRDGRIICLMDDCESADIDALALSQVPESMDRLEELLAWEEMMGGWEGPVWERLKATMVAMGYVLEEEELPEPEINPSES